MIVQLKKDNGFTLMELLIVITIIGVLLAIGVVNYYQVVNRTKETECRANQRTIKSARMYNMMNNGVFGSRIEDLEAIFETIGFVAYGSIEELVCPLGGTYIYNPISSEVTCSIEGHN